jgi:hypothetical protein
MSWATARLTNRCQALTLTWCQGLIPIEGGKLVVTYANRDNNACISRQFSSPFDSSLITISHVSRNRRSPHVLHSKCASNVRFQSTHFLVSDGMERRKRGLRQCYNWLVAIR